MPVKLWLAKPVAHAKTDYGTYDQLGDSHAPILPRSQAPAAIRRQNQKCTNTEAAGSVLRLCRQSLIGHPSVSASFHRREWAAPCFAHNLPPNIFRLMLLLPFLEHRQADLALNRHDDDGQQQRPQAELEPAAFTFRRLGFGRLGFHRPIIRRRGQRGQEIRSGR